MASARSNCAAPAACTKSWNSTRPSFSPLDVLRIAAMGEDGRVDSTGDDDENKFQKFLV